jgi:hypothetical protein
VEGDNLVSLHLVILTNKQTVTGSYLKTVPSVCSQLRFAVCPPSILAVQMALALHMVGMFSYNYIRGIWFLVAVLKCDTSPALVTLQFCTAIDSFCGDKFVSACSVQ